VFDLKAIKGFGEITLRGLVAVNAPSIFRGVLISSLKEHNITVNTVVPLVQNNKSLWSLFPPDHYGKLERAVSQVPDLNWLTVDWLIDAIKNDLPALASLFLSWVKGRNWLERQILEIKAGVEALRE